MNKENICYLITKKLKRILELAESNYEEIVMGDVIDGIEILIALIKYDFDEEKALDEVFAIEKCKLEKERDDQ